MEQKKQGERIKTALERALEKVDKLEVSEDKVKELELFPEGAKLAARYFKGEKQDLPAALASYDAKARKYVLQGLETTLLNNIHLAQTERGKEEGKKALEGISQLKKNKGKLASLASSMEQLFQQYEQTRRQYYNKLRGEFEGALKQAMQQQAGVVVKGNVNVEAHPEFQQKWLQLCGRLDAQYQQALDAIKQEIARLGYVGG